MSARPFSNGAQALDWTRRNCHGCSKFTSEPTCEIDVAIARAYFGDGTVPDDIAQRMGFLAAEPTDLTWDCPERETP